MRWGLLSILFVCSGAFASELEGLKSLFTANFYNDSIYIEARCQDNIGRFVELAHKQGYFFVGSEILGIENAGFNDFGYVNVVSARGHSPERNWFHHAVLVYQGNVFDFDFTNRPEVLPELDYWKEMFLDKDARKNPNAILQKLGPYKVTSYPTPAYLKYLENKRAYKDASTKKYLKDRLPELFR